MRSEALCPDPAPWRIARIASEGDRVVVHLEPMRTTVACAVGAPPSRRGHRRYQRRPWISPRGVGPCHWWCRLAASVARRRRACAGSAWHPCLRCWRAMGASRNAGARGCWNWPMPVARRRAHAWRAGWDTLRAQPPSFAVRASLALLERCFVLAPGREPGQGQCPLERFEVQAQSVAA
jgi:hypothetical protein